MADELVEVKIADEFPNAKYRGLCGFYIAKGEIKLCPLDVFQDGQVKNALVLAKEKLKKPKPEEKPQENIDPDEREKTDKPEEKTDEVDFNKEVKDVTDAIADGDLIKAGEETKDLTKKVFGFGRNKKSKK